MERVHLIDTTIRDGQGSLWATGMRNAHMVPIIEDLDAAGFDAIEFLAPGSRLKKFVRDLKENPWDWIHQGAKLARLTPLRWHGSIDGEVMSGRVPPEVGDLLTERVVDLGIRYTRVGNNWNNYTGMPAELARYNRLGMVPVINVIYSVSPRHTDEYFVEKARQAAALNPYRLCFKDVGGLLTPDRVRALVPRMLDASHGVTWEFHGHCNNGLGQYNALECVKAGIRYIHTAVPPLANGDSQPSVFAVVRNLREMGYEVTVDEARLKRVSDFLTFVARREGFPIGNINEFDARIYRHQIPGGMISNLRFQLAKVGITDRFDEVLEETARVREDFGYPIMVTPLSQFVGSQAALNVLTGTRYKEVTDSSIEYALGRHGGQEAIECMNTDVRNLILDRPRTREVQASLDQDPPTIAELRNKYGRCVSDEDLILMAIVGDDALDDLNAPSLGHKLEYSSSPLIQLVAGIFAEKDRSGSVSIKNSAFSLQISR